MARSYYRRGTAAPPALALAAAAAAAAAAAGDRTTVSYLIRARLHGGLSNRTTTHRTATTRKSNTRTTVQWKRHQRQRTIGSLMSSSQAFDGMRTPTTLSERVVQDDLILRAQHPPSNFNL